MYGSRGCTSRREALDCQNCILPVPTRMTSGDCSGVHYGVENEVGSL
eukprot:SAG25_NODE_212_length_11793_cov_15.035146_12_plen_47_part_00